MSNEVDQFLADVKSEVKGDPFLKEESDPLKETPTKDVSDDEKKDDKKDKEEVLPYHKDPKVQRFIEKEISKRLKDIKPTEVQKFAKDADVSEDELTESLIEIIGNDTPQKVQAIKKFRERLGKLEERGAERALEQLRKQAEEATAEETRAMEEIANAFDEIEEQFDVDLTSNTTVAKKERSDFIEFIKRISPKDGNGDIVQYPDFNESWKLYQGTKKPTENKRAKDIASRSMERPTDTGSAPTTSKTWKDVDRIFSKL